MNQFQHPQKRHSALVPNCSDVHNKRFRPIHHPQACMHFTPPGLLITPSLPVLQHQRQPTMGVQQNNLHRPLKSTQDFSNNFSSSRFFRESNRECQKLNYSAKPNCYESAIRSKHGYSNANQKQGNCKFVSNLVLNPPRYPEVAVSFSTSPEEVFLQYCCYNKALLTMMEDIQISACNSVPISNVTEGLACLAMWPVDQRWYRAQVREVNESEVLIFYVDYGEQLRSKNLILRVMEERYTLHPFFAFKVKLASVLLRSDGTEKFQSFMKNNCGTFLMTVVKEEPTGIKSVKLRSPDNEEDLASRLFQRGIVDMEKPKILFQAPEDELEQTGEIPGHSHTTIPILEEPYRRACVTAGNIRGRGSDYCRKKDVPVSHERDCRRSGEKDGGERDDHSRHGRYREKDRVREERKRKEHKKLDHLKCRKTEDGRIGEKILTNNISGILQEEIESNKNSATPEGEGNEELNADLCLKNVSLFPINVLNKHSNGITGTKEIVTISSDDEDDSEENNFEKQTVEAEKDSSLTENPTDNYMPPKIKFGQKHPNPIIESASLAGVVPPDVSYKLVLPEEIIKRGLLSAPQLETIIYSCQQHQKILPDGSRAGFLIGDGPGVGKGRIIAGIILENYLRGRKKAIWLSSSADLKYGAVRDLCEIGAGKISVHALNKMKYAEISADVNGSVQKGVVFLNYFTLNRASQLLDKFRTRIEQLLDWCGKDFDGVIVFDEAKNLFSNSSSKLTKTGLTVLRLQNMLPQARIVYVSSTGISDPRSMVQIHMVRLGVWGQDNDVRSKGFGDFLDVIEKSGLGAMEVLAKKMKENGKYIARQLSFRNVVCQVEKVSLTPKFSIVYDTSVKIWIEILKAFNEAANLVCASLKSRRSMLMIYWMAHLRYFQQLCISAKITHTVKIATEAVNCGKCVVISLQSTGEARTLETLENEGQVVDFVSTAHRMLRSLVEKHFPEAIPSRPGSNRSSFLPNQNVDNHQLEEELISEDIEYDDDANASFSNNKRNSNEVKHASSMEECNQEPSKEALDKATFMKNRLLAQIDKLGTMLPRNVLDELIDELGGPDLVAEMTGRKGRVIQDKYGNVRYESRSESDVGLEMINIREKERFMAGEKKIIIISDIASSGISLQADRRVKNQRQRVHITLELPWGWSADRAIQQFGRTHRCNQICAPEYVLLISDLAGESHSASVIANRLRILGASIHSKSQDFGENSIDSKHGYTALCAIMNAIYNPHQNPLVPPPVDYKGEFFKDVAAALVGVGLIGFSETGVGYYFDKDCTNVSKFLHRILGIPVDIQNRLFQYFVDTMFAIINRTKK